jgi:hypothetical protein
LHGVREVDLPGLPDRAADGCLAWPAVREEGGRVNGIITVGEFIIWKQPDLIWLFREYGLSEEPMTLDAVELKRQLRQSPVFWWWARLMQERPLPGRAWLLPGEKAV